MRISYDPEIDAAYIHFTDLPLEPGRDSIPTSARTSTNCGPSTSARTSYDVA
jgi:hypothetical protein